MRRLLYVLFCVFIIQRALAQPVCQSDLYISMDDLLRAINSGKLNLNQGNQGRDVCGTQLDIAQDSFAPEQNLINTEIFPISNQPVSYQFQPSFEVNQDGYGYQPSISFPSQSSLSIGSQNSGYQPTVSLNQPNGYIQQPSISFPNQPSFAIGSQSPGCQPSITLNKPSISFNNQPSLSSSCGSQPSISLNQPSGCNIQQSPISLRSPRLSFGSQNSGCEPSISLNQPSGCGIQQSSTSLQSPRLSFSSQNSGCQPSISLNQPSTSFASQPSVSLGGSQCGNQPSASLNNLCGYQPSLSVNQKPSLSFVSQPTITLPNQSCGSHTFSARPSVNLPCANNQQPVLNSLSSQTCQIDQQVSSNQCGSKSSQNAYNANNANVANIGNNFVSVVPNALLQAPPFGIFFEGDNLTIDGAVQVCGTMPFNSAVRISCVLPASGTGNVQYSCNDVC